MAWARADDLDGTTDNVDQVTIGFQGKSYVLDLSERNLNSLAEALAPYINASSEYDAMPPAPEVPMVAAPTPAPAPAAVRRPATKAGRKPAAKAATSITSRSAAKQKPNRAFFQLVRQWANENGFQVSETGRIPALVLREFEQAQQKSA